MEKFKRGNIYSKIPLRKDKELFQPLLLYKKLKIERIISRGQSSAKGKWLKAAAAEWVIILKGSGKLRFRQGNRLIKLKPGDYLFIPANTFHRVEWTPAGEETLWLAVHYESP